MLRVILIAGWKGLIFIRKAQVSTIYYHLLICTLFPFNPHTCHSDSLLQLGPVSLCLFLGIGDSPLASRMRRRWPCVLKPSDYSDSLNPKLSPWSRHSLSLGWKSNIFYWQQVQVHSVNNIIPLYMPNLLFGCCCWGQDCF